MHIYFHPAAKLCCGQAPVEPFSCPITQRNGRAESVRISEAGLSRMIVWLAPVVGRSYVTGDSRTLQHLVLPSAAHSPLGQRTQIGLTSVSRIESMRGTGAIQNEAPVSITVTTTSAGIQTCYYLCVHHAPSLRRRRHLDELLSRSSEQGGLLARLVGKIYLLIVCCNSLVPVSTKPSIHNCIIC